MSNFAQRFRATITLKEIKPGAGPFAYIEIPEYIAADLLQGKSKIRTILTFDTGQQFHRAIQKRKLDGFTYISLGNTVLKEAKARVGETIEFTMELDNTKYGMPMPAELGELLKQDEEGAAVFDSLNAGLQRSFLHYIGMAKTFDTRMKRSLQLVENIKRGKSSFKDFD